WKTQYRDSSSPPSSVATVRPRPPECLAASPVHSPNFGFVPSPFPPRLAAFVWPTPASVTSWRATVVAYFPRPPLDDFACRLRSGQSGQAWLDRQTNRQP